MSPQLVSRLAKAATGMVVAVIQLGLLAALAVDAVRPTVPDQGGAPVIELTLTPRNAFNSVTGSTDATEAKKVDTAAPASNVAAAPIKAEPVVQRAASLPAPMTTDVAYAPLVRTAAAAVGVVNESDDAPAMTGAPESRRGLTDGGGAPTTGASAGSQIDDYYAQVLRWVEEHKRHPGGVAGVVTVAFTLDRRGRVSGERVLSSSGRRTLDAATLRQLKASQPFPRPPSDATWRTREFRVRLDYRARRGDRR